MSDKLIHIPDDHLRLVLEDDVPLVTTEEEINESLMQAEESLLATDRLSTPQVQATHEISRSDILQRCKGVLSDLFSDRVVQLRRLDVTTVALQGAVTGVAAMTLIFALSRP